MTVPTFGISRPLAATSVATIKLASPLLNLSSISIRALCDISPCKAHAVYPCCLSICSKRAASFLYNAKTKTRESNELFGFFFKARERNASSNLELFQDKISLALKLLKRDTLFLPRIVKYSENLLYATIGSQIITTNRNSDRVTLESAR